MRGWGGRGLPKPNSQHGAAGAEPPQDIPGIQKRGFPRQAGAGCAGITARFLTRGTGRARSAPRHPHSLGSRRSWGWASPSHPTESPLSSLPPAGASPSSAPAAPSWLVAGCPARGCRLACAGKPSAGSARRARSPCSGCRPPSPPSSGGTPPTPAWGPRALGTAWVLLQPCLTRAQAPQGAPSPSLPLACLRIANKLWHSHCLALFWGDEVWGAEPAAIRVSPWPGGHVEQLLRGCSGCPWGLGCLGFVSGGRCPTLTAPHGKPRVSSQHGRQVQPPPHFCLITELVLGWGKGHGGRMVQLWPGLQVAQGGQNAPRAVRK